MSGFIDWLENLAGQLEEIAETRTEKKYLGDDDPGGEPEWMSDSSKAPNDRLFWVKVSGRPWSTACAAWRTGKSPSGGWVLDECAIRYEPFTASDNDVTIIHEIIPE